MTLELKSCPIEEMCVIMGGSMHLLEELRGRLRDWLRQQPHLPQEISDERLNQIIVNCKHSLEKSKQTLDIYFTIRSLVPEVFHDRDPSSKSVKRIYDNLASVALPKLTLNKYKVNITKFLDTNSETFHLHDIFKIYCMIEDVCMSEFNNCGNIIIYDLAMFRLGHLTKFSPVMLKNGEIIGTKAYPSKLKAIHLLNPPNFIDRIMWLAKSVLKPKLAARIHVHTSIETLYDHIPKSILPVEYGGEEMSLAELNEKWYKKLLEQRDWFLNEGSVTVNESLRSEQKINYGELFGVHGSFRKLEVD